MKTAGSTFLCPRCSAAPPRWVCRQRSQASGSPRGSFPGAGRPGWTVAWPWCWSCAGRGGDWGRGSPRPILPGTLAAAVPRPRHSRCGGDIQVHVNAEPQAGIRDERQGQLGDFDGVNLLPAGAEMKVSGGMCSPWLLSQGAKPKSP